MERDYGVNLLGAMTGGVAEYLSLIVGYRWLAVVIAVCYLGALIARQRESGAAGAAGAGVSARRAG